MERYVASFVGMIEDFGLYIEIKDFWNKASFGFFKKTEIIKNKDLMNKKVVAINCQYFNGKRLLVLETE